MLIYLPHDPIEAPFNLVITVSSKGTPDVADIELVTELSKLSVMAPNLKTESKISYEDADIRLFTGSEKDSVVVVTLITTESRPSAVVEIRLPAGLTNPACAFSGRPAHDL